MHSTLLVQEFKCGNDKKYSDVQYVYRRYRNHFELRFSFKVYTWKKFSSLKTVHVTDVSPSIRWK